MKIIKIGIQTDISIGNLSVCHPCEEEQNKIARAINLIHRKIELVSEKLAKTKEFKKGLLQKMFV